MASGVAGSTHNEVAVAITSDAGNCFLVNGNNVELTASGAAYITANGSLPYRSDVSGSSLMAVLRLDVPIQAPITAMFGRIPVLEPLSIFGGGGVGVGFSAANGRWSPRGPCFRFHSAAVRPARPRHCRVW